MLWKLQSEKVIFYFFCRKIFYFWISLLSLCLCLSLDGSLSTNGMDVKTWKNSHFVSNFGSLSSLGSNPLKKLLFFKLLFRYFAIIFINRSLRRLNLLLHLSIAAFWSLVHNTDAFHSIKYYEGNIFINITCIKPIMKYSHYILIIIFHNLPSLRKSFYLFSFQSFWIIFLCWVFNC